MKINIISKERWHRGEEHESKLSIHTDKTRIDFLYLSNKEKEDLEWCLVENLRMWPHPKAPKSDDEHDYPSYRNRWYQELVKKNRSQAPGYAGRDEQGGSDF